MNKSKDKRKTVNTTTYNTWLEQRIKQLEEEVERKKTTIAIMKKEHDAVLKEYRAAIQRAKESEGFYRAAVEDLKRLKTNYQNDMNEYFSKLK